MPQPLRPGSDLGTNALAAAMTFALAVALFTLLGHWADGKCGTGPLFLIVGFLLGATGGLLHLLARLLPGGLPFGKGRGGPPAERAKGSAREKPPAREKDPPA